MNMDNELGNGKVSRAIFLYIKRVGEIFVRLSNFQIVSAKLRLPIFQRSLQTISLFNCTKIFLIFVSEMVEKGERPGMRIEYKQLIFNSCDKRSALNEVVICNTCIIPCC